MGPWRPRAAPLGRLAGLLSAGVILAGCAQSTAPHTSPKASAAAQPGCHPTPGHRGDSSPGMGPIAAGRVVLGPGMSLTPSPDLITSTRGEPLEITGVVYDGRCRPLAAESSYGRRMRAAPTGLRRGRRSFDAVISRVRWRPTLPAATSWTRSSPAITWGHRARPAIFISGCRILGSKAFRSSSTSAATLRPLRMRARCTAARLGRRPAGDLRHRPLIR